MRNQRTFFVTGLAVLLLAARTQAAVVGCTVSGQERLVFDSNGDHQPNPGPNPGIDPGDDDTFWTFTYDDEARVFMIEGHGMLPIDLPSFHERYLFAHTAGANTVAFQEILRHTSGATAFQDLNDCHRVNMVRATFSKTGGASSFNHMDVNWLRGNPGGPSVLNCIPGNEDVLGGVEGFPALAWSAGDLAFSGDLVDPNGDGTYDRRQGVFNLTTTALPWVVSLLVDAPLSYYPSQNDRQYVVLPESMVMYIHPTPSGPFDAFVPMHNDAVTLACGGNTLLEATLRTAAPSRVARAPAFNPRGLAALMVLILVLGTWLLRRRGAGDGISIP